MTHNQIAYWQLQETRSHNTATRAETARTNRANEALKHAANTETQRHNTVVESIDQFNAYEKSRSNRANEAETHRSNVARENETSRHNLAQEGYADREVSVKEALLPSEIAKNYGSAAGYGSKLITGLANVLGSSGPLYALSSIRRKKDKDKQSNSGSSGPGGGSSSTKTSHVTTGINPSLGRIITPTNDKLSDVANKVSEELKERANRRQSDGGFNGNRPDRGTRAKSNAVVDAVLNTALVTATRVALAPYLGPAASGVAAAMPYVANELTNLITP